MKQYNIKLNKQQLESLKSFLERANMSGREVQSFMYVVNAINEAERLADQPRLKSKQNKNKIAPSSDKSSIPTIKMSN
jgi:tRNA C32,U32 (ribose-2'-O)-methylase TrmJ